MGRNNRLTQIAGKLRAQGLEEEAILEALLIHPERDELPENECGKIAKSVCRYPAGEARNGKKDYSPVPNTRARQTPPEGQNWFWPTPEEAEAAFAALTLARDDEGARQFFEQEYGLPADPLPEDWRVLDHSWYGRGIVYRGDRSDGLPAFKFKSFNRDDARKRNCRFLHGADSAVVLLRETPAPWCVVAGEEKALAANLAGYNVLSPMTGEKRLAESWIKVLLDAKPERIVLANDADEAGRMANAETAEGLEAAGYPSERIRIVAWPEDSSNGL